MRDRVARAVEKYIDNHRDKLKDHVDRNLENLKGTIVERLPDKIIEFIKKKVDDGDDEHDSFLENVFKAFTSLTDKLSDDFVEDVREDTRRHIDEVTIDAPEKITDVIVTESKKAVWDFANDDDDDDDDDIKNFFKNFDFGFLREGKEGIINKIIELIKPSIHESGEEINKEVSEKVPQHVKGNMVGTVGKNVFNKKNDDVQSRGIFSKSSSSSSEEDGGKKLSKILKVFGEGKDEGNFIDRIFAKLPARISNFIRPFIEDFEESLLRNIEEELRNNIFRDDKFKGEVKSMLLKFGGDSDGDGKNFLTEAADAVSSFFKKK